MVSKLMDVMTSDVQLQLFHAARGGDSSSLGTLLEWHRPRLRAAALRYFGMTAEAEDAVEDTILTALLKFQQVRDAEAFPGWLHATLRNTCLMRKRTTRREESFPMSDVAHEDELDAEIERTVERDRVWNALNCLSEPLRATVMLRYYSRHSSYESIAETLAVPVGTVRSRLSQAKTALAKALHNSPDTVHDYADKLADARRLQFLDVWQRMIDNDDRRAFHAAHAEDMLYFFSAKHPPKRGRIHFEREVAQDFRDGVRITPSRAMACGNLTILEGDFQNPPDKPYHCPPQAVLVMIHGEHNDRVHRLHLYNSPRLPEDPLNAPRKRRRGTVSYPARTE
jgi:RNA polymerase sigma-70 factor (ECF subfamily)